MPHQKYLQTFNTLIFATGIVLFFRKFAWVNILKIEVNQPLSGFDMMLSCCQLCEFSARKIIEIQLFTSIIFCFLVLGLCLAHIRWKNQQKSIIAISLTALFVLHLLENQLSESDLTNIAIINPTPIYKILYLIFLCSGLFNACFMPTQHAIKHVQKTTLQINIKTQNNTENQSR